MASWSVGVITAPRRVGYYLSDTIRSLRGAGWDELTVFADRGAPVPQDFGGVVVRRPTPYGDWTNWATALFELLLSRPDTDYFLMAEDDGLYCKGCRAYLEWALPQLGDFATASPYTPGRYHLPNFRGFQNRCHGALTWSTLSVVMTRHSAVRFFSDPLVQRHRFEDVFAGDGVRWGFDVDSKNSAKDALIGKWAEGLGLPVYYHTPCLAAHVGVHSTLSDRPTSAENLAADFVGEDADLSGWTGRPLNVRRFTRVPMS